MMLLCYGEFYIWSQSKGFGKADHAKSKKILQTKYGDYDIEISDEGY